MTLNSITLILLAFVEMAREVPAGSHIGLVKMLPKRVLLLHEREAITVAVVPFINMSTTNELLFADEPQAIAVRKFAPGITFAIFHTFPEGTVSDEVTSFTWLNCNVPWVKP